MGAVTQAWTHNLSMMQQTVLLECVRGPDTLPKYHVAKFLLRWFRRCVLVSALDGAVLEDPVDERGGSFTGPSFKPSAPIIGASAWEEGMDAVASDYLRSVDEIPHHFHLHLMHASEILGYKHPVKRTRAWWHAFYLRLVNDMHLAPESEAELDGRLGDTREGWLARADEATVA